VRLKSSSQSRRQISNPSTPLAAIACSVGGTCPPKPDRAKEDQLLGTTNANLSDNYATGAQECVRKPGLTESAGISVYAPPLSLPLFLVQFVSFSASG
jgi:hypothetical protein